MKKEATVRAAAIAALAGAALVAAIAAGDDPRGEKRNEFFQTAQALRSAGVDAGTARGAIKARSNASDADVDDIIDKSFRNRGRDPESLRTVDVTIIRPDAAGRTWQTWANAWCEPLTGLPQYDSCVVANNVPQGVPMCVDGVVAGFVARVKATPAFAAKLGVLAVVGDATAAIAATGWTTCP